MKSFPFAEKVASEMKLPMAVDPVEKELYGTTRVVLDMAEVRRYLASINLSYFSIPEVLDCVVNILESRLHNVITK